MWVSLVDRRLARLEQDERFVLFVGGAMALALGAESLHGIFKICLSSDLIL